MAGDDVMKSAWHAPILGRNDNPTRHWVAPLTTRQRDILRPLTGLYTADGLRALATTPALTVQAIYQRVWCPRQDSNLRPFL